MCSTNGTCVTGARDPYQACVDRINKYHTLTNPPLTRRTSAESCVDSQAASDYASGTPHSAFGRCGEWGQCECPGWSGADAASVVESCIDAMWAAGPGEGHHDMIASGTYTQVACGFSHNSNGTLTLTQDYYR
jgi:hypothetical protein